MTNPVVELSHAVDVARFGGKAVNLGIMLKAGLPVPAGFAVSIDAFDSDGQLLADQKNSVTKLLKKDVLYAVRSSATVEDAEDQSWAGQFETFLYVPFDEVVAKVSACHGAIKARARAYADQQQEDQVFNVGVVVQEMIDPVYAGVLFTQNPVTGDQEYVGEYVSGIGEQLVGGTVTPEDFTWNPKTRKLTAADQLPFEHTKLVELGAAIQELFDGKPQDIEWAIDRAGKVWITQSRPITTLQIEQVGEGYHYLGDPQDLFYWGPANARALYMSDFLAAIQKKYSQWQVDTHYPNPPKTLLLLHSDKMLWLNSKADFANFTTTLFERYFQSGDLKAHRAAWADAVAAIDENKAYAPDTLLQLLDTAWQYTFDAEFALYGAENAIAQQLNAFDDKDIHRIWGAFSLPDTSTFINQIDQDVLRHKDPKQLAAKYPWALNSYAGVAKPTSLITYFTKRISDLKGNNDVILGSASRRAMIANEFGLSKALQDQLDLAREIAEFMDDRKAWMMRSRQAIQHAVQAEAKKRGVEVGELERCLLDNLSQAKPQPYFGWTYINGKNIDLTKADVQRSWDWYVEYRAATRVLKGIVSSRGGKHFMTGEVIVVHDPSESVPDGKVVVVPSTGPSFVPIMRKAAALITDHGGMMSHAAIVAREFNLPCIVGTVHATKLLKNGDKIVLDLVNGEVNR